MAESNIDLKILKIGTQPTEYQLVNGHKVSYSELGSIKKAVGK